MQLKPIPLALAGLICAPCAFAVGVANEAQLEPMTVIGTHAPLAADLPHTTASKTTDELAEQNLFNPEDALRYMPNTTIRKRYIGDRNALIGGRNFGTLQPQRALVYVDDYLISNFLGRFDAPRWNMVTPEAIERVDVLYGPYSALYPGNSIGTTVIITEKSPQKTEGSVKLTGYTQRFNLYGDKDHFNGGQASAYLGSKLDSGLWAALTLNHQDSTSQPMQYFTLPVTAGNAGTRVTGIQYDKNPFGVPRAVFGANSGAIDHTVQDTAKLKIGYAFTPEIEASALIGGWQNDTKNTNRTFLRDAVSGAPVYSGTVTDGVNSFSLANAASVPSLREETHRQLGATLKTKYKTGWNSSVVLSNYKIIEDINRIASSPEPVAINGGAGTVTRRDGTGWNTFEIQALYRPTPDDFGNGKHGLTFGIHRNAYELNNIVNNASDWRSTETTLNQLFLGNTEIRAFYAQDVWKLSDTLKLTTGVRFERFEAFDGEQMRRVSSCAPGTGAGFVATCTSNGDGTFNRTLDYDKRKISGTSPKVSLAWSATNDVLLKASYGRGIRFPNVEELYNGTVTATSQNINDPNLKAESGKAFELSGEKFWERHTLRVSAFFDEVEDAILRQLDVTVTPKVTNVSNVDRVRTTGIEFAWNAQDWMDVRGLSLDANLAFTRSKVEENAKDPLSVGKYWLRVPKTRGNLLLAYRPNDQWMGSVGYRHEGRAYNDVYNRDINIDTFGAVSRVNQIDLRLRHTPKSKLEFAVGVDNATDERAYQYHPYPGRTLFAELKAKL